MILAFYFSFGKESESKQTRIISIFLSSCILLYGVELVNERKNDYEEKKSKRIFIEGGQKTKYNMILREKSQSTR